MAKFNLAQAAGYASMVSKLDTDKQEIRMISLDKIDVNHENFFDTSGFEDLKESIEVNGVLQPILLVEDGERFKILAGHRRFKACDQLRCEGKGKFREIPAVVLPPMSEAMEQLVLIQTNTTAREMKPWEKVEAAARLKRTLVKLKEEGVKLPGKLRDIVAEQLEISKTEAARLNVIDQHLSEEWKHEFKCNKINASCAYELARLPEEDQHLLMTDKYMEDGHISMADVGEYSLKAECAPWLRTNCEIRDGWYASEQRKQGKPVECNNWIKIRNCKHDLEAHNQDPALCVGCCRECARAGQCLFTCNEVTAQRRQAERKVEEEEKAKKRKEQEEEEAARQRHWEEAFQGTKAHHFAEMLTKLLPSDDPNVLDDVAYDWCGRYEDMCAFGDNQPVDYSGEDLVEMMKAKVYDDIGPILDINLFMALCETLGATPNQMLGYDAPGGWHKYPETCPDEYQRVVVQADVGKTVQYKETVYYNGEFFPPEDVEDGIYLYPLRMKVKSWTPAPEGAKYEDD